MKNQLLSFTFICLSFLSIGQYSFSKRTGVYANLSGDSSLTKGLTWIYPQLTIPIGFNFTYFDTTINTVYIEDLAPGAGLTVSDSESGIIPALTVFGADIIDWNFDTILGAGASGGISPISYKLSGLSGNRILKIQWKNVGFVGDMEANGMSIDYVNFQLWLYEDSNTIEIHFGPNNITQPSLCYSGETRVFIELIAELDFSTFDYGNSTFILTGNPSNPTFKNVNSIDSTEPLNGTIPNGTIYKFKKTSGSVSIFEIKNELNFSIFPIPSQNYLQVRAINSQMRIITARIMDVNGKLIKNVTNNLNSIDIKNLDSGIYFIQVTSENGQVSTKRFIKN